MSFIFLPAPFPKPLHLPSALPILLQATVIFSFIFSLFSYFTASPEQAQQTPRNTNEAFRGTVYQTLRMKRLIHQVPFVAKCQEGCQTTVFFQKKKNPWNMTSACSYYSFIIPMGQWDGLVWGGGTPPQATSMKQPGCATHKDWFFHWFLLKSATAPSPYPPSLSKAGMKSK